MQRLVLLFVAVIAFAVTGVPGSPKIVLAQSQTIICQHFHMAGGVLSTCPPPGTPGPTPSPGQTGGSCSPANYVNGSNFAPDPANFCQYSASSPFRIKLPDVAHTVDSTNTSRLASYISGLGSGNVVIGTYDNNFCKSCGGQGGFPTWYASNSDPSVTFFCNGATFGCYLHDVPGTFSVSGHIPSNARPACNVGPCGDENMEVIQPDGSVWDIYGCSATSFSSGQTIGNGGSACSISGGVLANVQNDLGLNQSVTTGDNFGALVVHYNEMVPAGAVINHSLQVRATCVSSQVYPATGSALQCTGTTGLPSGAHIVFTKTHAQIDSAINAGTMTAWLKPLYYAMHDYGAYLFDTGGCPPNYDGSCARFEVNTSAPPLEEATPWLVNGQTNPWVPWFSSHGASLQTSQTGMQIWFRGIPFWQEMGSSNLIVVDPCYAHNNCTNP